MSRSSDFAIYGVHIAFWATFGITRAVLRKMGSGTTTETRPSEPVAQQQQTAPFSRLLLAVHMVAFGVMYFGLGQAVIPGLVPDWFPGQRLVGALVIAVGAALMAWSLVYFRSWRFRAKLDEGHQLATGGPFRLMRHPIYMGLNLLALGTVLWMPTIFVWVAFVLMVLGSDLRARAEERLLEQTFGASYTSYRGRTKRFLPGLY
jgi:protein-S-isoprenylcysteine O-methyltransferase Ste14